jgi:hypothetical protein
MRFWLVFDIVGTLVALAVLVTAVVLEPRPGGHGTEPAIIAECNYRARTGRPCLSCGMTTAFVNMVRARPVTALEANPAGVFLFLLTAAAPFWLVHAGWTRRDPFRFVHGRRGRFILPALAVCVVGVWVIRTL